MSFNASFIFDAIDKLTPITEKISKNFQKIERNLQKVNDSNKKFNNRLQELSKSSNLVNNSIVRLATGYLSLRTAINFGKDLIQAQVQLQNINAALKSVTGSQALATQEFNFVKKAANEIGVSFDAIIKPYTKYLAASKDSIEVNRKVFISFSKIARLQGLNAEQTKSVFLALEQMQSKGKVASQELRLQLGNALPGAFNLFAEAAGLSTQEFTKFLEQGRIGAGLISRVADLIEKKFGKDAAEAAKTLGGDIARLQNAFGDLKRELSTGIFSRTIASAVIFLTKHLEILSKAILTVASAIVILKIPALIIAIKVLGASFLLLLAPAFTFAGILGGIALTFAVLFINWEKFRNSFLKTISTIKDFFKGEGLFGKSPINIERINEIMKKDLKTSGNFTKTNNVGFNGTLNIKNAPAGSTAEVSPFGSINPNIGLNMSFAPNGGI